jgi:hypothetical protein
MRERGIQVAGVLGLAVAVAGLAIACGGGSPPPPQPSYSAEQLNALARHPPLAASSGSAMEAPLSMEEPPPEPVAEPAPEPVVDAGVAADAGAARRRAPARRR